MKIKNGLVFDPSHQMLTKDLCFENGTITETSATGEYDATGCYVLPGLIDTHIHDAYGVEFYASEYNGDIKSALDFLSAKGVTSFMPPSDLKDECIITVSPACIPKACRSDTNFSTECEWKSISPLLLYNKTGVELKTQHPIIQLFLCKTPRMPVLVF